MPPRTPRPRPLARFLLRLPTDVRAAAAHQAESAGLSMNEYVIQRLREPGMPIETARVTRLIAERLERLVSTGVIGIIVHGSFVRGEARDGSDVDALVVLEREVPLARELYRAVDHDPLVWRGRPVDLHFVHLPTESGLPSGLWCEAAVEGLVVADPDGRLQRALVGVRRAIAEGRLVRKRAHGQPYWTEVA